MDFDAAERWLFENRGCFTVTPEGSPDRLAVVEAYGHRVEREVRSTEHPEQYLPAMVTSLRGALAASGATAAD